MQEPGEKQDQHGLGDFRGLEGEVPAEANPAMGVMRTGDEKNKTSNRVLMHNAE